MSKVQDPTAPASMRCVARYVAAQSIVAGQQPAKWSAFRVRGTRQLDAGFGCVPGPPDVRPASLQSDFRTPGWHGAERRTEHVGARDSSSQ